MGDAAVAVGTGVGAGIAVGAVLLFSGEAVRALPARVHHAPDAHPVTDSVLADIGAHLGDDTDDLVDHVSG